MLTQGGHQAPGSMPATGKATTLLWFWTTLPSAASQSGTDGRGPLQLPWRQTPRVSSLFWMETNPGLACLGPRVQHLGRFQRGTSLQQDSINPGAPRGQEWNSRTGNWLRTDLPRQLPASVRLAPLLTHVRAAGTQNLCEEFKIPSELASLSSENAKCHFKKKAGWRWRACLCPPHTPLQTNH